MHDVAIIGAGPAGLTLGCYLAQAGLTPLILEKLHHPRPHVGESLMPATVRILRDIGFDGIMEDAGFPRSGGVVYHPQTGFDVSLDYGDFPQEGIEQAYTWHVDRARFDMLLMKHAEASGCRIVEGVGVEQVTFDDDGRATGVRASVAGQTLEMPARVVVDAAGRATRIGRQLGLRRDHSVLDQFALHTWCSGVRRGRTRTESYTHVYFLPDIHGWAWQAPINEEITSIGIVASRRRYQATGLDIEDFFHESLRGNPKLARATRSSAVIGSLRGDVNYSYALERVCGDGWLAVGDAARFVDPVFSSGVSVAMHSARDAAEAIQQALDRGDTGRNAFLAYEDGVLTSAAILDDFIRLFYRLLPAFVHLLESREHRGAVMRMIQGDVRSDSDASVLAEMRALVRSVEEVDTHPWRDELVELPSARS